MGFFDKAKCLAGFHDLSEWSLKKQGDCSQTRYCKRCDKKFNEVNHDWSQFLYISDNSCSTERTCKHCGLKETSIANHQWAEWQYIYEKQCYLSRVCSRCNKSDFNLYPSHRWGAWNYVSPNSCDGIRYCQRCTEQEIVLAKQENHKWSELSRVDCSHLQQECTRCEKIEKVYLSGSDQRHRFGAWQEDKSDKDYIVRKCQECYKEEFSRK